MIPIAWRCEPIVHSKPSHNGWRLIAEETVPPFRKRYRVFGHVTLSHLTHDMLMLQVQHDASRLIQELGYEH